jgi:hypothetical protein
MSSELYGDMNANEAAGVPGNIQRLDPAQYIPPTRRQQLLHKRANLEHMLDIVNRALAALDAHPDLEEFAEALARAL